MRFDRTKTFRHGGLEKFFMIWSKAGIQSFHAQKLGVLLNFLDQAVKPEDM